MEAYPLSHDECVFMQNTGYGFLSRFLMTVTASQLWRIHPTRIEDTLTHPWHHTNNTRWLANPGIPLMTSAPCYFLKATMPDVCWVIPSLWPGFSLNYERYKPRWSDERTNIGLSVCGSISSWAEPCVFMLLAKELGWHRYWSRSSAIVSRSTQKAKLFI